MDAREEARNVMEAMQAMSHSRPEKRSGMPETREEATEVRKATREATETTETRQAIWNGGPRRGPNYVIETREAREQAGHRPWRSDKRPRMP